MWPLELHRILDGLISGDGRKRPVNCVVSGKPRRHTAMNDTMNVVEVSESFEHSERDFGDDLGIDGADAFINPIKGTLVHELHADANVGIRQERAVERDDVSRVTVVHDLQFAQDLFANRRLRVDEDDLGRGSSECRVHHQVGAGGIVGV